MLINFMSILFCTAFLPTITLSNLTSIAKPIRSDDPAQRVMAYDKITDTSERVRLIFWLFGMLLVEWVLSGVADNEGARAENWNTTNNETKVPYEFTEIDGRVPLTSVPLI